MAQVRQSQGTRSRNLIIPAGVELETIKRLQSFEKRVATLLFIGYLTETKGVQLIVEAMPEILRALPAAKLIIVGNGPMESPLKEMVTKTGLRDQIEFRKPMPYEQLMKLVSECSVGLAPYMPVQDSYSRWGDPMKIKEYAAFGLPIVMTRVPQISKEVSERGVGIVIDYDRTQLAHAVVKILSDSGLYMKMSENAVKFAQGYNWDSIFGGAFETTLRKE